MADIAGELGEINIVRTVQYAKNIIIDSPEVTARIEEIVNNFQHYEDAQMAAWIHLMVSCCDTSGLMYKPCIQNFGIENTLPAARRKNVVRPVGS